MAPTTTITPPTTVGPPRPRAVDDGRPLATTGADHDGAGRRPDRSERDARRPGAKAPSAPSLWRRRRATERHARVVGTVEQRRRGDRHVLRAARDQRRRTVHDIAFPTTPGYTGHRTDQRHDLLLPDPGPQRRRMGSAERRRQRQAPHRADRTAVADGDARQRVGALTWSSPANNGGAAIDKYSVQRVDQRCRTVDDDRVPDDAQLHGHRPDQRHDVLLPDRAHNAAGGGPHPALVSAKPRTVPGTPLATTATPGSAFVKLAWVAAQQRRRSGRPVRGAALDSAAGPWAAVGSPTTTLFTNSFPDERDDLLLPDPGPQRRRLECADRRRQRQADRGPEHRAPHVRRLPVRPARRHLVQPYRAGEQRWLPDPELPDRDP